MIRRKFNKARGLNWSFEYSVDEFRSRFENLVRADDSALWAYKEDVIDSIDEMVKMLDELKAEVEGL